MTWHRLGIAAVLILPLPPQSMLNFTAEHGRSDEKTLRASISFGAGNFFLRPSTTDQLYRMELQYDAERYAPRAEYDKTRGLVQLGAVKRGVTGLRIAGSQQLAQTALIELSPAVDLVLEASLGAAESSFELGGLRLTDLDLTTGASRTEIRFSRPNPAECRHARVAVGAAGVTIKALGNSGCARWEIDGGVGSATLDLSGPFPANSMVSVKFRLGSVTLKIPRDLGVRLSATRFLTAFNPRGFDRDGEQYVSPNYRDAALHVDLRIETMLGEIKVDWIGS
jgi:hypothetical protein